MGAAGGGIDSIAFAAESGSGLRVESGRGFRTFTGGLPAGVAAGGAGKAAMVDGVVVGCTEGERFGPGDGLCPGDAL